MTFILTINNVEPLTYNRFLRNNRWGGRYKTKDGKEYEAKVKEQVKEQLDKEEDFTILKDKISMYIEFHITNNRKNDIDNLIKPILDILSGMCYKDDRQIWDIRVKKIKSKTPMIRIRIMDIYD